ncbi:MAG TPA: hypothetical protein DCS64_18470, partial [Algoriphagus sp.]
MSRYFGHITKSWGILLGGLLLLVATSQLLRFRLDLTDDKRYSLHPATEEVLAQLETPLHVE